MSVMSSFLLSFYIPRWWAGIFNIFYIKCSVFLSHYFFYQTRFIRSLFSDPFIPSDFWMYFLYAAIFASFSVQFFKCQIPLDTIFGMCKTQQVLFYFLKEHTHLKFSSVPPLSPPPHPSSSTLGFKYNCYCSYLLTNNKLVKVFIVHLCSKSYLATLRNK